MILTKPETPKRIKTDNTLNFRNEVGAKDTVFTNIDYTKLNAAANAFDTRGLVKKNPFSTCYL
jgi:hypothetical protein